MHARCWLIHHTVINHTIILSRCDLNTKLQKVDSELNPTDKPPVCNSTDYEAWSVVRAIMDARSCMLFLMRKSR